MLDPSQKRKCPVCREWFWPRNYQRHVKACNRRARAAKEKRIAEGMKRLKQKFE